MWTKAAPCRCKEQPEWPIDPQKENEFLNRHFIGAVFGSVGFLGLMGSFILFLWFAQVNPFKWSDFTLCMIILFWGALLLAFIGGCIWLFSKIICPCCGRQYILGLRYSRRNSERCANCGHPGLENV